VRITTIGAASATAALMLVGLNAFSQSKALSTVSISETDAKPLLLERNEGELRIRRIHVERSPTASSQFTLKVNGSQHLRSGYGGSCSGGDPTEA
jgi:hypothetical protein